MSEISKPALENVMNDNIRLVPEKFKNTYRHWMENVHDWCISRQLWGGQQIPAWYDENGDFVDNRNKLLKYKSFSDSFRIEGVVLSTGEKIAVGNVLIPFYPTGQSDNVILHILVNKEENWSLRIYKMRKEPEIFQGYIDFTGRENEI